MILTILKWFQFSSNISRLVPLRNDFNDNGKYSWFLFDACQNLNYFSKKKKPNIFPMSVVGELIGNQVPSGNNTLRVNIIEFCWKGEKICVLIILDTRANHLGRFIFYLLRTLIFSLINLQEIPLLEYFYPCVLSWGNIPLRYTQNNLLIPIFPALLLISQEDPCIGEHTQS